MGDIKRIINTTLYDHFGQNRIDDSKAVATYGRLLEQLDNPLLLLATTNYDRAAETAITGLGQEIDTGFRGRFPRTPTLSPSGMIETDKTPIIHLHGAVGWYEREGAVEDHYADQPYNSSLGTPVVLYPDPEKDPTSDTFVDQLWAEFRAALDIADTVLVIGHSLHDPALTRALVATSHEKQVVISIFDSADEERVERLVPRALVTMMDFGPDLALSPMARRILTPSGRKGR
jgi:hypothetical protein